MRDAGEERPRAVLVSRTLGAQPPPRRRLRRPKPREAAPGPVPGTPVTRLTVIEAEPLPEDPEAWLRGVRAKPKLRDELAARALLVANRALAARRVAVADPAVADATPSSILVTRIGYGSGDEVADGRWEAAVTLPREETRVSRAAALRPQERLAAIVGGREQPLACEELLVRARADIEARRLRVAALQLRVGLEALLADREALAAPGQEADLASADARRGVTADAAAEALRGPLAPEREAELAETLAVCERVLRRRAAHG